LNERSASDRELADDRNGLVGNEELGVKREDAIG
jgi:hypothetical protein